MVHGLIRKCLVTNGELTKIMGKEEKSGWLGSMTQVVFLATKFNY